MSKTATRDDVDEVLGLMKQFMQQSSEEFQKVHESAHKNSSDIQKILGHLDSMEKQLEINEDERIVMGHQLDRLNQWTNALAKKIGYELKA